MAGTYSLSKYITCYPAPGNHVSVYHRISKKTYLLGSKESRVLMLFDGVRTTGEIHSLCPFFTEEEISQLAQSFLELGFFTVFQPQKRFNPFKIQIKLFNPNRLLSGGRGTRILYTLFMRICPIIFLAGAAFAFAGSHGFWGASINLTAVLSQWRGFRGADFAWVLILTLASLFLHEFGHAAVARTYGVNVPEIGFMLYLLIPTAYTNISGIRLLGRKKPQIEALLAGSMVNFGVIGLSWILLYCIPSEKTAAYLLILIVENAFAIGLNTNIFVKYDCYYIFEVLLDEPGLHDKALAYSKALLQRGHTGDKSPVDDDSTASRAFYIVYGMLCAAFIPVLIGSSVLSYFV